MKMQIEMRGLSPLLMHNIQLSDPLNSFAKALKKVSAKRTKTEDDHLEMAKIEFYGGIYFDEELGPYMPAENIHRAIQDGAKLSKNGKNVERGLIVLDDAPIIYEGPRDVDSLWEAGEEFADRRAVRVGQAKCMRTRPCFRGWTIRTEVEVLTSVLDVEILERVVLDAGMFTGIGDFRPRFGRFEATVN